MKPRPRNHILLVRRSLLPAHGTELRMTELAAQRSDNANHLKDVLLSSSEMPMTSAKCRVVKSSQTTKKRRSACKSHPFFLHLDSRGEE